MQHFSTALAGESIDPKDVFQEYLGKDKTVQLMDCPNPDISETAKSGKLLSGAGFDTFKYAVYKQFPQLLEALHPVYFSAACDSPPLQWFIHILQELYKNKGDPHLLASYRDILLANTSGKHFGRFLRMQI